MIRRHSRSNAVNSNTNNRVRRLEEEKIIFIAQDLCKVTNGEEGSTNNAGQFQFLRVGQSRNNELRKCFLDVVLPEMSNVEVVDIKLCLYQYFSDSDASFNDQFSLHAFDENWNEDTDFSPTYGDTVADDFTFSSSKEGKQCIGINASKYDTLRKSTGVIFKGKSVEEKKERYFLSSEWTSHSNNVTEGVQSKKFHPHWVITTKTIEEYPTAFPSSMINSVVVSPPLDIPPGDSDDDIFLETGTSYKLIFITASVAFCCLTLVMIILIQRKKADRRHERMLRTFVTQEDLDRRGKFSFNSLNSSNKAGSGNSGTSFKWIENVKLDNAGGDQTICNNIDQKIDHAAFPSSIEKPNGLLQRQSTATPKKRNPTMPFDYLGNNTMRKGIQRTPQSTKIHPSLDQTYNEVQQIRNVRKIDEDYDSIKRMKDRIKARQNLPQVQSQLNRHDLNSNKGSYDYSYPSLFSSSDEDKEEGSITTSSKCCLDEMVKECERTRKDAEKLWKEGFKSSDTFPTNGSSEETSTHASTLTFSYR